MREARRADDLLDRGDWQREVKASDWDAAIKIAVEALTQKTKDLQIAVWLTEALTATNGFAGLASGLRILTGFLRDFWEHVYPEIEEGDLDFRIGPLEFLNDKIQDSIKQISLTDARVTTRYSWFQWQDSRRVGYEKDTVDQHGSADYAKKEARDELIAEGKPTPEDVDSAVAASSRAFYESLAESLTESLEEFKVLDDIIDEKFGAEAPRVSDLRTALEDCEQIIRRILKRKRELEPDPEPVDDTESDLEGEEAAASAVGEGKFQESDSPLLTGLPQFQPGQFSDSGSLEQAMWEDAIKTLQTSGIQQALATLFGAACSAPSVREKHRYRLLMAKLCLRANRPDLARPIVEELNAAIDELGLERWESPVWIAEVIGALYQCLTAGEASDDDIYRANELFQKLCTTDVTKAMIYRN